MMKKNKLEIICSFCMVSILGIMMFSSLFCSMIPKFLQRFNLPNETINNIFQLDESDFATNVDYEKMYPFENKKDSIKNKNVIDKYLEIVNRLEEKIEKYTSEKLLGYEKMVELSYYYNDFISYKIVSNSSDNSRIDLGDGYYSRLSKKKNVDKCSNNLIDFSDFLKKSNIDLLYVQAPFKISSTQTMLSIYKDFSNENMDKLLNNLNGNINYIDLRKNIKEENKNHLKLFYKTDHHWLPETGLWATKIISEYLNNNYDIDLELKNVVSSNFTYKNYPNMYLGSDGRYVSLKNAQPENFSVILPNFDTKLEIQIPDLSLKKIGNYQNTLIDWSQVKYTNYYKISQYNAYAYGDRALIEIHNQYVNNNKKILLIKDSFGEVVAPFLSLENEYLSVIDLRHFNGSLKTYINNYNPNIVIVLYNGNMIVDLDNISKSDISTGDIYMWNFE